MLGKEKYKNINRLLSKEIKEKRSLIAVHRGYPGGNIVENTIPAFYNALKVGGDMFEMDLIKSTDGVLYIFHDGMEERNFKIKENIKTMSSKEIDSLCYYNSVDAKTDYKVILFEDAIKEFKNNELYNIDRAWGILPEVFKILDKYNVVQQALLKSPVKKEVLEFLDSYDTKYMYMPIVYSMEEVYEVLKYDNINVVGVEIIAENEECDLFKQKNIEKIKNENLFVWVNAITLDNRTKLFAGLDDDISVIENPDKGWGKLYEKKIDILQTDWPSLMYEYRKKYFNL